MHTKHTGFSLIELLVALSILAVVAAIIVPRFLNVRTNAAQSAAAQNMREVQGLCQKFIALGGTNGGTAGTFVAAGDMLNYISGNGGTRSMTAAGVAQTPAALGNACDSSGTMSSGIISLSPAPTVPGTYPTSAATIAALGAGFGVSKLTAGATAYYCDGNGSAWTLTVDGTGVITATPIAGSNAGALTYAPGTANVL